ncbi:hypothetical protein [Sphingopyxis sp.]|uniref:hypothetical protein n=1 Tax=Sphingopyxis sp. TaxID=1908224 RepID=UPI002FC5E59E
MRIGRPRQTSLSAWPVVAGLLISALSPTLAVAQNLTGYYDNWILMADDTMSLALTTDDQEAAFGLVCGPECYFYIESRIGCVEGRDYPVAIETGTGGYAGVMTCKPADRELLLMMPQDERFLKLIAKQDHVRLTIDRNGGETSRFRFSLVGSEQAIGIALAARAYFKPPDAAGALPTGGSVEIDK